jgi:hypothetical protein
MKPEFRAILLAAGGVSARVGSRIAWGERGQGLALPAIVLDLVSEDTGLTLEGPDGLWQSRVQVDCYALSYAAADDALRAVIAALHGYRGGVFHLIEHVGGGDNREGGSNEADRPFQLSTDFMAHWSDNT